jgi:hypothetical protein
MSAKHPSAGAATALRMKKDNPEKALAKLRAVSINGGSNGSVSTADPASERGQTDIAGDTQVKGAEANSVNAFVTLLQELLRNILPKFDPIAMIEFRAVLEKEITSALEAKGVCACQPHIMAALKENQVCSDALKNSLNDITRVSELNDIKRAASSRIKLLTTGKTYRRKMIKGNEYLYEVYWDPNEKKKKYKYVGPATSADTRGINKNGDGENG